MKETLTAINKVLVEVFNNILTIEENAIKSGRFNDISISELHTIEAVGMYSSRSMGEIAKDLDITVGTLTVAVNNLVKKGYCIRNKCQQDRRVVKVALTNKGRLVYRVHDKFHRDMVKNAVEGLDKEEEIILSKSLLKLNDFLKDKYLLGKGEK